MCLGVPGKVVAIDGPIAEVELYGVRRAVHLQSLDEPVAPGDYVLSHVGVAVRRIPPDEADALFELFDRLRDLTEASDAAAEPHRRGSG